MALAVQIALGIVLAVAILTVAYVILAATFVVFLSLSSRTRVVVLCAPFIIIAGIVAWGYWS